MKVLLVDDDQDVLNVLSAFFETKKHNTFQANNGAEALDLCLGNETFDLILSDIRMPVMDGLSFLKKLHEHDIETPVVFISGPGERDMPARALELGALDFISKPFRLKTVENILHRVESLPSTVN